ncbi:MAG: 5-oxoprolinase subunit PxpB [Armatimonadetes bacterium]|nr:5-oxoprolinase subunit PxpB [Armatimonadota bacterium]
MFRPLGDQGVLIRFGDGISLETHQAIHGFCAALARDPVPGVVEWVPAYATVAVYYRPQEIGYDDLVRGLGQRLAASDDQPPPARVVEIPTVYGGEHGPDLEEVAVLHGLTAAEVVARHSRPEYLVHILGFAPGFPYLGGLPEYLATPRLAMPRVRVPAGSVAIGGAQTGIYPLEMPGGWRLIGRTPLRLFAPDREPPTLLQPGDRVRFVPITTWP